MVVPYISETLLFSKDKLQTSKKVKVFSRSSKILLHFLDKTFLVYNGHKFVHLLIKPEMIGHKFGEFVYTKKRVVFKSKKKK
uniref:Ribosomal protein S19 n=1 Tax=Chattonella marina TaxID=90936 RepID=D2Z220_9STRA|nr:ribosomal protein S19 [Chattonella marina]BAI70584.1 ribosomal protein S19 [Chattonella marina]